MKIRGIIDILETAAPLELQEEYDNAGLIVGCADDEVESAIVCVDVTENVMEEAIEQGSKLIISHHPLIFRGLKTIGKDTYIERIVRMAIKNDIAIYACHTNLDRTRMSLHLAAMLGLTEVRPLPNGEGFGVVGVLKEDITMTEYLQNVMSVLCLPLLKHSQICSENVKTIALCTGAGRDMMKSAREAGAQLYLSSEFRHNDYLDADNDLTIADIGHWESELCACEIIETIIRKKNPTFAVQTSAKGENPVKYFKIQNLGL